MRTLSTWSTSSPWIVHPYTKPPPLGGPLVPPVFHTWWKRHVRSSRTGLAAGAGRGSVVAATATAAAIAAGMLVWQQTKTTAAATTATTTTTTTTTLNEQRTASLRPSPPLRSTRPWSAAVIPTTRCEATAAATTRTIAKDDDEDDPYANLPDTDEPTDCSMCRTFREGPCRPYWRKLERCFKDHTAPPPPSSSSQASTENDDDDDESSSSSVGSQCVRYFSPHQECLSRYINLYQLIDLQQTKQVLADDTEQAMRADERQWWTSDDDKDEPSSSSSSLSRMAPSIDFAPWIEFRNQMGPSFCQTIPMPMGDNNHGDTVVPSSTSSSSSTIVPPTTSKPPLWKRLPDTVEPVLIATRCTLPMMVHGKQHQHDTNNNTNTNNNNNQVVKFAYAVDQDGFVIGLGYNSYYADLLDQAKEKATPLHPTTTKTETTTANNSSTTTTESPATASPPPPPPPPPPPLIAAPNNKSTSFDFTFYIMPGETHTVRIVGLYFESPLTAPADKIILDATLYTTRTPYDLETVQL